VLQSVSSKYSLCPMSIALLSILVTDKHTVYSLYIIIINYFTIPTCTEPRLFPRARMESDVVGMNDTELK